jgi:hypothetical protein
MPNPNQPHAVTQYQLVWDAGGRIVTDLFDVINEETQITSTINGISTSTHLFKSKSEKLAELLKFAGNRYHTKVNFRVGINTSNTITWDDWHRHFLEKYGIQYLSGGSNSGYQIVLSTQNAPSLFNKITKFAAHKGKISAIIKTIADNYGLDSVIEETEGDFILYQSNQTDADFIETRLLPRAVNKKGHAGYVFFINDNILHFHSPFYQNKILEFDYPSANISDLQLVYKAETGLLWGKTTIFSHDPYTGQSNAISSSYDSYVRLSDYSVARKDLNFSSSNLGYHLSTNNPEEVTALAQADLQKRHLKLYKLIAFVDHRLKIKPGDLIKLNIQNSSGTDSGYGGLYLVSGVSLSIENTLIKSAVILNRGEYLTQTRINWAATNPDIASVNTSDFSAYGTLPKINPQKSLRVTLGIGPEKLVLKN